MLKQAFFQFFQLPDWLRYYQKNHLNQDALAGLIVGILAIPQSLGYAVLAGLPPVYGLYSSIVPVLVYAWIGSSNVNAVGSVAITAMMTAQALQPYAHLPVEQYVAMSSLLALLTGGILWLASIFRFGWITQFISRGVTAGFISGSAILIFVSQLKFVTNINILGNSLIINLSSLWQHLQYLHLPTLMVGCITFFLLIFNKYWFKQIASQWLSVTVIGNIQRVFPLVVVILSIVMSYFLHFQQQGIRIIGDIPQGLPSFALPYLPNSFNILFNLLPVAGLVALVAFISSSSVAGYFARQRQEYFNANQELKGLGLANIIGSFFQIFTVTGGFSRTAMNVDAGAKTPLASVISVVMIIITLLAFAKFFSPLPYAILGAIIMVAVIGLVDIETFLQARKSDKLDAIAFLVAFFGVLLFGLNIGLILGLFVSFAGLIWQSSHPHIAIVGQIGETGHFRNIHRHQVTQHETLLIVRIDESLFYGNAQSVRQFLDNALKNQLHTKNLLLMLSAVNHIDLTAQDMLINLNQDLKKRDIQLHFSEVKGPVMDNIEHTDVIQQLSGKVFLSTQQAVKNLMAT